MSLRDLRLLGSRLALLLAGLLTFLIIAEGLLQIGALIVRVSYPSREDARDTEDLRILCVGDSNTWGLGVEQGQSYPSQLAALWEQGGRAPDLTVLNLGWPGQNSTQVLRDFPRMLRAIDPDLVLLLIGNNDFWTVSQPPGENDGLLAKADGLWRRSRLYKLYRIAASGDESPELELIKQGTGNRDGASAVASYAGEKFHLGFQRVPREWQRNKELTQQTLDRNLREIIEIARDHDTLLTALTYPSSHRNYKRTNPIIRSAAADTGTALIDLAEAFARVCPERSCAEYLDETQHPTARGYGMVAEIILGHLTDALAPGENSSEPQREP